MTSFPDLNVVFCADIDVERAKSKAAEYGVPDVGNTAQALDHPDVEIVVNLTVPAAHAEVSAMAIAAGKHVWVEKPLALDTASGQALLKQAERGRGAGRLRSGHPARRRAPDLPPDDRGREHRRAADRAGPVPGAGAGALAPRPAVPVPGRRRPAVRHGAVLPDHAGLAIRARAQRGRGGRPVPRPARGGPRPPGRDDLRCRGAHACVGADQLRRRAERHDRAQLRLAAAPERVHRGHRHRGDALAARPEPVRRRGEVADRRR